jgi:hypothetical protein
MGSSAGPHHDGTFAEGGVVLRKARTRLGAG